MRRVEASVGVAFALALMAGCGGEGGGAASNPTSSTAAARTTSTTTSSATASTHTRTTPSPPPARKPAESRRSTPSTPAATVEAALTSARCDLYTPRLLNKSYGGVEGCKAALKSGGSANSVEVQRTQPEGNFALVIAVPRGGPSSGEKLAISLVGVGGDCRLDAIHSNVEVGP